MAHLNSSVCKDFAQASSFWESLNAGQLKFGMCFLWNKVESGNSILVWKTRKWFPEVRMCVGSLYDGRRDHVYMVRQWAADLAMS